MSSFFFNHFSAPDWVVLKLTEDEFYEMCYWAFGLGWRSKDMHDLGACWNDLHSDLLTIYFHSPVDDTLRAIRDLWKASAKSEDRPK